jgi:hypothetical protein
LTVSLGLFWLDRTTRPLAMGHLAVDDLVRDDTPDVAPIVGAARRRHAGNSGARVRASTLPRAGTVGGRATVRPGAPSARPRGANRPCAPAGTAGTRAASRLAGIQCAARRP